MRFHLDTLGCRLNEAEVERWARELYAMGLQTVGSPSDADLVVINTCAVTEEAVRKSRKLVRQARRANPEARLVVSGCYASLEQSELIDELGVDMVVTNQRKDELVQLLVPRQFSEMAAVAPPKAARRRHRAFIKIQDGCRYRCAFCIVTIARGSERSRPSAEVIDEINLLLGQGIREVVLTGVHLGGYGHDIGSRLSELVRTILGETNLPRLRLGSLEPWELGTEFWELFSDRRLQPHLHLPLQSGSDTVLRRMSRRGRARDFEALIEYGREAVPDLNVTTDIIAGFPGESTEEWSQTLGFVAKIGFGHLHVFPYSRRAGTKAAELPGQVSFETTRRRVREMLELGKALKSQVLARHVGRELEVLIESENPGSTLDSPAHTTWSGYTPSFVRVLLAAPDGVPVENRIRTVRILGSNPESGTLTGQITDIEHPDSGLA